MTTKPNPKGKIVCCIYCGRDTKSTYAICYRCIPSSSGRRLPRTQTRETTGRSSRSTRECENELFYVDEEGELKETGTDETDSCR